MPRAVNIDLDDRTIRVILQKTNGAVGIGCDYAMRGDGVIQSKSQTFEPAEFTAAERTVLGNAYTIVRDKAHAVEAV